MFKVLIDTCVWLDIAKDHKQHPIIDVIEVMVRQERMLLIAPDVLVEEFRRNRERIAKESARSLATHFRVVRDAVKRAGAKPKVLAELDEANRKAPLVGGAATQTLDRIERLLLNAPETTVSDAAKLRAAERAMHRRAPFHRNKNSMADAIIFECYVDAFREARGRERLAFVSHNTEDFSSHADNRRPHADLASGFSKIKSLYFINALEALRRIDLGMVRETLGEAIIFEPRTLKEIREAENLLYDQVWYDRHRVLLQHIADGRVEVTANALRAMVKPDTRIYVETLETAKKSAKRLERSLGAKLGPWSEFEWGMISGKLSALRWVLGDEWDMLDV
jgi:hypothetical protein